MKSIFIIEHLEPKLFPWCVIEYKSISKIVGKNNLWITNISKKDNGKLVKYCKVINKSVKSIKLENACILDPEAKETLSPKDKNKFIFFIFGGILGDYPPRKRTQVELTKFIKNVEIRNIGKEQFSTDNAVFVTQEILKGKELKNMKFQNTLEIKIDKIQSTILPFKYPLINGKPRISKELVKFIKNRDKY